MCSSVHFWFLRVPHHACMDMPVFAKQHVWCQKKRIVIIYLSNILLNARLGWPPFHGAIFVLRMLERINSLSSDLDQLVDSVSELLASGTLNGFSDEWGTYFWYNSYVVLRYHIQLLGWGMVSRQEAELDQIYQHCAGKPFVLHVCWSFTRFFCAGMCALPK